MTKDSQKVSMFEFVISEENRAELKAALAELGEKYVIEDTGTGSLVVTLSNAEIAVGLKLTFA